MYVKIKASKTDPFRVGVILRLASINNHALCPVRGMRFYLRFRSTIPGPLFIFDNGVYLSRAYLAAFLQISLPAVPNINTHSFRIGGASAALSAGASDALIRIMGRWSIVTIDTFVLLIIRFSILTKLCLLLGLIPPGSLIMCKCVKFSVYI